MCYTMLTLWVKCGHQTRHVYPCEQCPNKLDISTCPLGTQDRRTRLRRIHCGCGKQLGPLEDSDEESTFVASEDSEGVGGVEVCEPDDEMGLEGVGVVNRKEGEGERVKEVEVDGDLEEPVTSEQTTRASEIEEMAESMYMDAFEEEQDEEEEEEEEEEL